MPKNAKILGLAFLFLAYQPAVFAENPPPAKIIHSEPLEIKKMKANPMEEFRLWYDEASQKIGKRDAATFTLATVSGDGKPSTRSMMAKNINNEGFSFIGNLATQKFNDLQKNSNAAITFYWREEQRQVNLIGKVEPLTREEAEQIFKERDFSHQISSLLFKDTKDMKNYNELMQKHNQVSKEYQGKTVPLPDTWGGYRFIPEKIEFWQAGEYNLHFRVNYTKTSNGQWEKKDILS